MRKLLHALLLVSGCLTTTILWAQPQAFDCNACVCTGAIAGLVNPALPVYPAMAAPVPVFPAVGSTTGPFPMNALFYFRTISGMTAPNRYLITLCGSAPLQNTVLHIRNNAGAAIVGACDDDGCTVVSGFSQLVFAPPVTASYRAYVFKTACNTAVANQITTAVSFSITNLGPTLVPNDDPCTAATFPPITPSCSASLSGTTLGATPTANAGLNTAGPLRPIEACPAPFTPNWTGGTQSDVWYTVPTPASGMLGVTTTEAGICAGALALYRSADCNLGPFTLIGGASNAGNPVQFPAWPAGVPCSIEGLSGAGTPPEIIVDLCAQGLSPGTPVYIRYWERNNNEQGTFTICAFEPVRPANDQPCTATVLDLTGFVCNPIVETTQNSTPTSGVTVPNPTCYTPTYPNYMSGDVWYQVTVPNPVNFTLSAFSGTLTDLGIALYRDAPVAPNLCPTVATCPRTYAGGATSTLTQLACLTGPNPSINTESPTIPLTVGEIIYVRVWSNTSYYGSFSICATRNTPPVNDLPCGALPIPVSTDCNYISTANTSAGNTSILTAGNPSCGVAPYSADVWYSLTIPADLVAPYGIQLNTQPGGMTGGGIAVYAAGPCAGPLTQITVPTALCNAPGAGMPNLFVPINASVTAGAVLYVRVWRTAASSNGTFRICARRTDPPSCEGTVYDPGGTAPYANNLTGTLVDNSLVTYCAEKAGDVVSLEFQSFAVENAFDFLTIFNGPNVLSPVLGTFTGTQDLGTITATISAGNPNGCLTLRFTSDFIINGAGWVAKLYCSPPPPPPPAILGICNTTVYDPGGPSAPYLNNFGNLGTPPWVQTYCPYNGNAIADSSLTLTFTAFNVEGGIPWDGLFIFNDDNLPANTLSTASLITSGGPATFVENANPGTPWFIGWGTGGSFNNNTGSPGTVSSTVNGTNPQGCLTFVLVSDASVTPLGWAASVDCGPPPPPPPPPTIGGGPTTTAACDAFFLDQGGNAAYSNAEFWTRTICPSTPGELVTATFQSFNVEQSFGGCFDQLYVYNGIGTLPVNMFASTSTWTNLGVAPFNTINGNGLGGWCGNTPPGPFTSSAANGCLTFQFFSDFSVTPAGWRARITCDPPPVNDNPCPALAAAYLIPVGTSCSMTPGTNDAASATPTTMAPVPTCGNYLGADVWYRFVAPPNGRVFIASESGTLTDAAMELYSGACPGPLVSVECDDDDGENLMPLIDRLCTPLTPGATYYIRVWGYGGNTGTFGLCITTTSSQTSQQDCAGAFSICSTIPFTGTAFGGGCSNDLAVANRGCLNQGELQGAWYAFSTQNPGTLGLSITPSTASDLDWAIWGPYPLIAAPNAVGNVCVPAAPPIRCSHASFLNTTTVGGANPTAATGMGRNTFVGAGAYALPAPAINEAVDGWVPGINAVAGQVYLLFVDDHHLTGATHTVAWNLAPANVVGCAVLPVDDLMLAAHPTDKVVDLAWTTSSEHNNSHFVVERSVDGIDYVAIGTVTAVGERTIPTNYQLTDEHPIKGLNYYRIQQVDHDGTQDLSNVVTALFEPDEVKIMVVPNPARNSAEVVLSAVYDGTLHVRVVDGSGRIVSTQQTMMGVQRFDLPVEKMEAGSYVVHLFTEKGTPYARTRFVKQ